MTLRHGSLLALPIDTETANPISEQKLVKRLDVFDQAIIDGKAALALLSGNRQNSRWTTVAQLTQNGYSVTPINTKDHADYYDDESDDDSGSDDDSDGSGSDDDSSGSGSSTNSEDDHLPYNDLGIRPADDMEVSVLQDEHFRKCGSDDLIVSCNNRLSDVGIVKKYDFG